MIKLGNAPLIKWTGSKRPQAKEIVDKFPKKIKTYYECFLGGGSVFHELMNRCATGEITVDRFICSDLNKDLIGIWNLFKNDREKLYNYYVGHYNELYRRADVKPGEKYSKKHTVNCQGYYYEERERFNNMAENDPEKPLLFFWLMRTAFNGLIRYTKTGKFNTPFHVAGRCGITPEKLQSVFDAWGHCIDMFNIEFINDSYENVLETATEGDLVYMDPPYDRQKGMYFADKFNNNKLYQIMDKMSSDGVYWLLSYDGKSGETDLTVDVPENLYKSHEYIKSGHSSFKKLNSAKYGHNKDMVYDSLYMNYEYDKISVYELF